MSFYSINNGAMMLTPSNHTADLYTLTIALDGKYVKLRNLRVSSDPGKLEGFFPSPPLIMGSGPVSLLFDQAPLVQAITKIADSALSHEIEQRIVRIVSDGAVVSAVADPSICREMIERPVGEEGSNSSQLFRGLMFTNLVRFFRTAEEFLSVFDGFRLKQYSFSCLMNASRKLEIVAKLCLSDHLDKTVFETDSVWAAGDTTGPYFPKAVLGTGQE